MRLDIGRSASAVRTGGDRPVGGNGAGGGDADGVSRSADAVDGFPLSGRPRRRRPSRALNVLARVLLIPIDYSFAWRTRARRLVVADDPLVYAAGDGSKPPVVLVPGVYETWHFLRLVAERLNDAGHAVHVVPALNRNTLPIEPSARMVAEHLERLDLRDVVLVAHSKGGLIGKYVMLFDDDDARVRSLVAIASPFSGSMWARVIRVPALRIFSPKDELVVALAAELEVNSRISSIYPTVDAHIPGGSRLPGARRNIRLGTAGHFRVLAARTTLDLVERFAAEPAEPAAPAEPSEPSEPAEPSAD